MVGCRLVLISLCGYAITLHTIVCESCESFYLNKWQGIGPVYHQKEGPANASKSLFACSRWCMEKSSCMSLSWNPGSCWQVGFHGTPIVAGLVYDLKKDPVAVSFELPMEKIDNGNLIGSINGAVIGGARLVSGKIGLALYTNGVDQCVDFGYQGDTCLGSISLCVHGWVTAFWMQPADENPGVIMDTGVYGYDRVWIFVNSLGFLKARFQKSYPYTFWELFIEFSSQQVWNHLVITWQLSCGAKLYINGQLVHAPTTSDKSPSNGIPRFVLGANNKCQNWYKAALDEFRFWDTVMSDEEVLALYTVDAGLN